LDGSAFFNDADGGEHRPEVCEQCSITFEIDVDSALETGALIVVLFQQNVNGRSHGQLEYIFVFPHLPIAMYLAAVAVLNSNLGLSESLVASGLLSSVNFPNEAHLYVSLRVELIHL